ncbi:MAG: hypothetical protein BZY79_04215 [SAR202 cluster bacterium Casp-Chloro-G4]|nr:VOC family protein [Chloroflexota bacterium]MDA1228300.1 VOC family protein [Chloroflexota bacterium]PKB61400.1 MAG: hypothetical protein BZY79_04215 [SAR202 cluster bacterium Casp-Chloro-G4]
MITGMHHTGFVVSDLERSIEFYRDVVGLTLKDTREREGGPISHILGYENTSLKIAELNYGDGYMLELIEYVSPGGSPRTTSERNALGASHIGFTVDDIFATYEHLVAHGGQKLNPPIEIVPGKKGCYLQDPDGNWVELVELG